MQNYWNLYHSCKPKQLYGPVNYRNLRAPNLKNPYQFSDMAFWQKLWQTKKFFKCISNSLISISRIGLYTPVVPSKTIPDSRPKWAKCIPVFRPKRPPNPTLWGCTYLYGLHRGVPRSPRTPNGFININHFIDEWLKSKKFLTNLFEEAELTVSP